MMMSGEEEKDVQAPESFTIEAPCPPADPGDGGGENNNGAAECMAIVAPPASEEETKIVTNNKEDGWEAARAWLMTLPRRRNVMYYEMEEWLLHNKHNLSREITSMPRQHLFRYLVKQHKLIRRADQPQSPQQKTETAEWLEPPTARFTRSDKWKPIYSWLESLDAQEVVRAKTIEDWLTQNPDVREDLESKHPRNHLIHYIQKCHNKILRKREKQKNIQNNGVGSSGGLTRRQMRVNGGSMQRGELSAEHRYGHIDGLLRDSRNSDTVERSVVQREKLDGGEALPRNNVPGFIESTSSELKNNDNRMEQEHGNETMAMALTRLDSGNMLKHNSEDTDNLSPIGKDEAVRRYELLSELENRLITLVSNFKQQSGVSNLSTAGASLPSQWSAERNRTPFLEGNNDAEGRTKHKSRDSIHSQQDLASHSTVGQARLRSSADAKLGQKRKRANDSLDVSVYALTQSEAHADVGVEQTVGFPRNQQLPQGVEEAALPGLTTQSVNNEGLLLEAVRERLERLTEGVPMARLDDMPSTMQSNVVGVPPSWHTLLCRVATGILSTGVWQCPDESREHVVIEPPEAP